MDEGEWGLKGGGGGGGVDGEAEKGGEGSWMKG